MKAFGSRPRHRGRADLSPGVEALEGRFCLSVAALTGEESYVYSRVGSPTDVPVHREAGGVAIQGGGTDIDAMFLWMQGRMGGKGDFLVLRSENDQGYNSYLYD